MGIFLVQSRLRRKATLVTRSHQGKVSQPLRNPAVTDAYPLPIEKPRRLHLDWLFPVLVQPRRTFEKITAQAQAVWLTPLLILSLTAVFQVIAAGQIKQQAALSGQVELPPGFEYYSPEDQAQFQKAMEATQSPTFIYVLPALAAVSGVWAGWLLVGGLLHLALTMLGGRGAISVAMNIVAWSSLPLAVRELVRTASMLITHRLISSPGLEGFVPGGDGGLALYLAAFLALVDIYIIWHILLLVIGVRVASGLSRSKVWAGVLMVILPVLLLQALLTHLVSRLSNLTIIRPFF